MAPTIIMIVCVLVLGITLPITHIKAYLSGLNQGREEMLMFISEVSPEAEETLIRDMMEKNYMPGGNKE